MKRAILNLIALLASSTSGLTIPAILPDPNALQRHDQDHVIGEKGLTLGCIAAIGIGVMFASLFVAWFGLLTYHGTAALFLHSDEEEMADKKIKNKQSQGWRNRVPAGTVLGTLFGLIFFIWGVLFVYNMVAAIEILGKLS
ncbi:hypothetical protein BKA65DRAFT_483293 [Rhexocercosporidium sp. MPI-PUGE-AT-0058]|nr:hypothetical protein BKA65DRAFT_483293 [Rhexocercosporidium sp. MPI-PUGE-AT-0058]